VILEKLTNGFCGFVFFPASFRVLVNVSPDRDHFCQDLFLQFGAHVTSYGFGFCLFSIFSQYPFYFGKVDLIYGLRIKIQGMAYLISRVDRIQQLFLFF